MGFNSVFKGLMSEICWAHNKWNKIASVIKLVFHLFLLKPVISKSKKKKTHRYPSFIWSPQVLSLRIEQQHYNNQYVASNTSWWGTINVSIWHTRYRQATITPAYRAPHCTHWLQHVCHVFNLVRLLATAAVTQTSALRCLSDVIPNDNKQFFVPLLVLHLYNLRFYLGKFNLW